MMKNKIVQYCVIFGIFSFTVILGHSFTDHAAIFAQENVCCGIDLGKEYSSAKEVHESGNPVVWRDFALQG